MQPNNTKPGTPALGKPNEEVTTAENTATKEEKTKSLMEAPLKRSKEISKERLRQLEIKEERNKLLDILQDILKKAKKEKRESKKMKENGSSEGKEKNDTGNLLNKRWTQESSNKQRETELAKEFSVLKNSLKRKQENGEQ